VSVYTLLNRNQLKSLLEQYGISQLQSAIEITEGIRNSNYLLKANDKEFVLTIFEEDLNVNFLPCLSFMAAIHAQGFAVPCPLLNKNGERLSVFEFENRSKRFIVCERLAGSHPKQISLSLCEHLGEQVAKLHSLKLSADIMTLFPMQHLPAFILNLDFEKVLSEEKLIFFKEEQAFLTTLNKQAQTLPADMLATGIGHCDFFPDNALIIDKNGKEIISGFLDWYDARNTYLILDLAIIAVSWCTENFELLKEKEMALLKGYQKVRPFTEEEQKLWNSFLRVGALSFWISREDYHAQMHAQGKASAINPKKSTEEFYKLLKNFRARF